MKGTKTILLFFTVIISCHVYGKEIEFKKQLLNVEFCKYDFLGISDKGEAELEVRSENQIQGKSDTVISIIQDSASEANFPGGGGEWLWYIVKNLDLRVVSGNGVPAGSYQVAVQFDVDERGKVGNVKAIEVPKACAICGREAVRVIKHGPIWVAAKKDGKPIASQVTRRITFKVGND